MHVSLSTTATENEEGDDLQAYLDRTERAKTSYKPMTNVHHGNVKSRVCLEYLEVPSFLSLSIYRHTPQTHQMA
jgi:hypothetical protein